MPRPEPWVEINDSVTYQVGSFLFFTRKRSGTVLEDRGQTYFVVVRGGWPRRIDHVHRDQIVGVKRETYSWEKINEYR